MNHHSNMASTASVPETKETPLSGEISNLEAYLTDLGVAQEVLIRRLEASVLRPDNVSQMASKEANVNLGAPRALLCPMGERISAATLRVRNFIVQTQQAIDRLEA